MNTKTERFQKHSQIFW